MNLRDAIAKILNNQDREYFSSVAFFGGKGKDYLSLADVLLNLPEMKEIVEKAEKHLPAANKGAERSMKAHELSVKRYKEWREKAEKWEETARQYCQNADYWREKAQKWDSYSRELERMLKVTDDYDLIMEGLEVVKDGITCPPTAGEVRELIKYVLASPSQFSIDPILDRIKMSGFRLNSGAILRMKEEK